MNLDYYTNETVIVNREEYEALKKLVSKITNQPLELSVEKSRYQYADVYSLARNIKTKFYDKVSH